MTLKNYLSNNINQAILETLLNSKEQLSEEATSRIKAFVMSQKCSTGGFADRSGKPDVYYSVFGYTLSLVLDVELNVKNEWQYIEGLKKEGGHDFIHLSSMVRCNYLLHLTDLKQKLGLKTGKLASVQFGKNLALGHLIKKVRKDCGELLQEIEKYRTRDGGYNHHTTGVERATVYASFLAWGLYQDLNLGQPELDNILQSAYPLQTPKGSFANEHDGSDGITSATAAGLIMSIGQNPGAVAKSAAWLTKMLTKHGGFKAAEGVPVADLLSTATALLALRLSGEKTLEHPENTINFINLHWDESGGFFGSVADMRCDVEYTYYALLAMGSVFGVPRSSF